MQFSTKNTTTSSYRTLTKDPSFDNGFNSAYLSNNKYTPQGPNKFTSNFSKSQLSNEPFTPLENGGIFTQQECQTLAKNII